MKKLLVAICIICSVPIVSAQGIIYENMFDGYANYSHFPHDGWVEEGVDNALWQFTGATNNLAGGEDSELLHYGSGSNPFDGMTRAVSPIIDLSGYSIVKFNFLYGGEGWNPGFEIGVATRSGSGTWNTVWSLNNEDDINGPTGSYEANVIVDNEDIGQSDVQFCFYLNGLNTDCEYLCFDNFIISELLQNDIYTSDLSHLSQVLLGDDIQVEATYYNNGIQEADFETYLEIYNFNDELVFSDTKSVNGLTSSDEIIIGFDPFTVSENNELYKTIVTHLLPDDENTNNDEMEGHFNSYSTSRQMTLLEIGTATWCSFCPGVSIAADEFVENGKDVAVIEYHSSDNYSTGDVGVRFGLDFYDSYSFPTSVFDGINIYYGGSADESVYDEMLPYYEDREAMNSPISLYMEVEELNDLSYSIDVNIEKNAPVLEHDYSVFLVMTESHIQYSWGQGLLDELNFVERFMLPNVYGRSIDLSENNTLEENFTLSYGDTIMTENCEFVAFVQNMTTLEILQAEKIHLSLVATSEVDHKNKFTVFPNPSTDGLFTINTDIEFINKNKNISVMITDMSGKTIKVIEHIKTNKLELNLSNIKSGVYIIQLITDNGSTEFEKLIIQ